jgi:hypothetical protein
MSLLPESFSGRFGFELDLNGVTHGLERTGTEVGGGGGTAATVGIVAGAIIVVGAGAYLVLRRRSRESGGPPMGDGDAPVGSV